MEICRSPALILNTLKFRDFDQILTLFSLEEGVIKLIFKDALRKKGGNGAYTAPFTHAEFIYRKGKSDLFVCQEISVIDQHLHLRNSIANLEAAADIVNALLLSQFPQKAAPDLFRLLLYYLKKIPLCADPHLLAASFRLKLLRHEGLLGITPECSVCHSTLLDYYVVEGESYCQLHASAGALQLTAVEAHTLFELALARSFDSLSKRRLEKPLQTKILRLFHEQIQR